MQAKPIASTAKNLTPWMGRNRSTSGSRDRPELKEVSSSSISRALILETLPFRRYPMTTKSTALYSSERIFATFKGSRLTSAREAMSSDLGSNILPCSSRRPDAKTES